MQELKEFAAAAFGIAMIIVMWLIGCMMAVVPLAIGVWLWRVIL